MVGIKPTMVDLPTRLKQRYSSLLSEFLLDLNRISEISCPDYKSYVLLQEVRSLIQRMQFYPVSIRSGIPFVIEHDLKSKVVLILDEEFPEWRC